MMNIEQTNEILSAADRVVTAVENKAAEIDAKAAQLASDYSSKKSQLDQQAAQNSEQLAIVASDGYRKAIEHASGGRNTVVIDDQGNPNVMVRIQRFNYEDINQAILDRLGVDLQLGTGTPTMFQRNGEQLGEVLIAKYLASSGANGGCSVIGGEQPIASVNYDKAKDLCNNKGYGWHMMSIHEWAAIALWSLANDTVPRGNTNYGRSHENRLETARRNDNAAPGETSGFARTDTGKGPATWSHDHSEWGIQDLVGNVWEWLDQMILDEGQIITTLDNNPAVTEENWNKHTAFFDSSIANTEGINSAGAPILSSVITNRNGPQGNVQNNNPYLDLNNLTGVTKSETYQKAEILRRLLFEFESTVTLDGAIYCRNYGTRFPVRGGSWSIGSLAGINALSLLYGRSYNSSNISFRPAFYPQ